MSQTYGRSVPRSLRAAVHHEDVGSNCQDLWMKILKAVLGDWMSLDVVASPASRGPDEP